MGLLTVTGGLTVAFVATVWASFKLIASGTEGAGHLLGAFKTLLKAVLLVTLGPPVGSTVVGFAAWIAGVML